MGAACPGPTHATTPHFVRVGEADNPGPASDCFLRVGSTNPSGLRSKESLALDYGPGIWHFSETQLSAATQPSCRAAIRSQGSQMLRDVRVHQGAPAPFRAGSTWAGAWSGVATLSDFPSRPLSFAWGPGHYHSGRIQAVQHFVGNTAILTANVYGYCQGPTWPDAKERTDALLADLSKEIVFGRRGIRIICGDWNHSLESLEQASVWRSMGWADAQDVAYAWWGQEIQMTCKSATRRDFVFLSPEAIALLREVQVSLDFPDHATVIAGLQVSPGLSHLHSWPLPSEIPWQFVQLDDWQAQPVPAPPDVTDSSSWLHAFSRGFEHSLDGFVQNAPNRCLPRRCRGRAARRSPVLVEAQAIPPRPHRPWGRTDPT